MFGELDMTILLKKKRECTNVLVGLFLLALQMAPAGVGATTFNIADEGAKTMQEDPLFDNGKLINSLIQKMPYNGGEIVVPAGKFQIFTPIIIDRSFVTIRGVNHGLRSVIDSRDEDGDIGGGSNLRLAPSCEQGIATVKRKDEDGENDRYSGLLICDLLISGLGKTKGQTGISIPHPTDGTRIDNITCQGLGIAVELNGADAARVSNNWLAECGTSLTMVGGKANLVVNNHAGANPQGITMYFKKQRWMNVAGNNIFPNGRHAIYFENCANCVVSANMVKTYYTGAIVVDDSDCISITGNQILGTPNPEETFNEEFLSRKIPEEAIHPKASLKGADYGLVHIAGNDNFLSGNMIALEGSDAAGFVAVNVEAGEHNRLDSLHIAMPASSRRKIVVDGMRARETVVTDSVTKDEIHYTGNIRGRILP